MKDPYRCTAAPLRWLSWSNHIVMHITCPPPFAIAFVFAVANAISISKKPSCYKPVAALNGGRSDRRECVNPTKAEQHAP